MEKDHGKEIEMIKVQHESYVKQIQMKYESLLEEIKLIHTQEVRKLREELSKTKLLLADQDLNSQDQKW